MLVVRYRISPFKLSTTKNHSIVHHHVCHSVFGTAPLLARILVERTHLQPVLYRFCWPGGTLTWLSAATTTTAAATSSSTACRCRPVLVLGIPRAVTTRLGILTLPPTLLLLSYHKRRVSIPRTSNSTTIYDCCRTSQTCVSLNKDIKRNLQTFSAC